ncbi:unnamed protein product [Cyclocybe aegerita]|uniref:Uncharacterized protein n=1 Tax=Cyclocybe aegerita TaxID=1973307 RepID=A0A8S0W6R5_CYCAE|nr:unnamed protein product [Cyclocybe aegerita]
MSTPEDLQDLQLLHTHLWGRDRVEVHSDIAGKRWSTINLTLFRLELNPRPEDLLLVREEYVHAYDTILMDTERQPPGHRSAFLVTGQPGIGKTLFLLYVLARRLQEKEPVALQINSSEYALFCEQGVSIHSSESGRVPTGAWALSDSSDGHRGLCSAFQKPFAHVIHTSSPASSRWKDWVKRLGAIKYIMDVWLPEEFRTLLIMFKLDVLQGKALFDKYGPSPRIIIDILRKRTPENGYLQDIKTAAATFARQFLVMFPNIESLDFSGDVSSKIFTVRPNNNDRRLAALSIPTPLIASALGVAFSSQDQATRHTFFNMLNGHPSLRGAAGWLFESYAHVYFSDPTRGTLKVYCADQKLAPLSIPYAARMIAGSTALKNIQPPHNFYWRPRETNYPGVDAVIRVDNDVYALQFTISSTHRSAADGLKKVHKDMNHISNVTWHLVMVGSEQRNAESVRDRQKLTDGWEVTQVYACELPLGKLTQRVQEKLQNVFDESSEDYRRANSDLAMV